LKFPKGLKEQAKIGAFLKNLDNLITLHQKELTKLQNAKKALFEKLFV
jgi:type I restriction enzyme S subunit